MGLFSSIFRKREKTKNPDGSKRVVVRDRFGNVRKIKNKDAAGYKTKQFFNRDGMLTKRKAKGPGMRRYKATRRNFQNVGDQEFQPGRKWSPQVEPNQRIGTVEGYEPTGAEPGSPYNAGSDAYGSGRDPYADQNVKVLGGRIKRIRGGSVGPNRVL